MSADLNENFTQRYAQLNQQQQAAVDTIEGPVIVLAGPGTGKTELLAMRVANILRKTQVSPFNILCLTFTESGVFAMRKRLIEIIGSAGYYIRIHTFHSFCNEVIQTYPEKFGFYQELENLTDVEKIQFYQDIFDHLGTESPLFSFGNRYLYLYDVQSAIQSLKREDITVERFREILAGLKEFLTNTQLQFTELFDIKAQQLTDASFSHLLASFDGESKNAPTFIRALASLCQRYLEGDMRDAMGEKKARTALRAEIKDLYNHAVKNWPKQMAIADIYESYQKKLREHGRYDYEDMILFVVNKFKQDEDLLRDYQERFQYILVDEYQDTNGAQNEVITQLGSYFESPNIFVVGDHKQSIYRFQGASLENILFFYQKYQDTIKVISLQENYRSQQTILDAAGSLIENNLHSITHHIKGIETSLTAKRGYEVKPIDVIEFESQLDENYFIANEIEQFCEKGIPPSEVAVLYRKNKHAADLIQVLEKKGINYRIEGEDDIMTDDFIRNIIYLLRYINNPGDSESLFHVLNLGFFEIASLDLIKLSRYAGRKHLQLVDVILDETALQESGVSQPAVLQKVISQLSELAEESHQLNMASFFDKLIQKSGIVNSVINSPDKVKLLRKLNSFVAYINQLNGGDVDYRLQNFVTQLDIIESNNLGISLQGVKHDKSCVVLMTAHKSKGLEFEYVFIMKATSKNWEKAASPNKIQLPAGLLQSTTELATDESIDEERRLFYVALTRAKKHIYVTYSNIDTSERLQTPTIFVEEIKSEYKRRIHKEAEMDDHIQELFNTQAKKDFGHEERQWLNEFLADYKMSATDLVAYLNCPRCFYYRKILNVPEARNKHVLFGVAVHCAMRDFHTAYAAVGAELPEVGYLLDRFSYHLKRENLDENTYQETLLFGKKVLADYYENYRTEFIKHTINEYNFRHHNVMINDVPITGTIDKIEVVDPANKLVDLVDYKTGSPDNHTNDIKPGGDYFRQLAFYKVLAEHSPEFKFAVRNCCIDFVEPSKSKGKFIQHKLAIDNDTIKDMEKLITEVYTRIKNFDFDECNEVDCNSAHFHAIPWGNPN